MTTQRPSAFTLIELMIAVALALLLILGINEVFSLTSKTVGAGQVLTATYQNDRGAQAVISGDFKQVVGMTETPALVIESAYAFAFRNRADQIADSDGKADTLDTPSGPYTVPAAAFNSRAHRLDRIGFFARGLFHRQTGTDPNFIDTVQQAGSSNSVPFSSSEAWIVYGHLNIPDNSGATGTATFPGAGTPAQSGGGPVLNPPTAPASNPNNFYGSQWVLGRNVFLLSPNPQGKGYYSGQADPTKPDGTLKPLAYDSPSTFGGTIDQSRYDAAQTTVFDFHQTMLAYLNGATATGGNVPDYWDKLVSSTGNRYVGNPFVGKLISSQSAAQLVPCFLPGCSHFAVEYAGDFVTQDANGNVTAAVPDGIPDFQVVHGAPGTPQATLQVRWYGLPRSTSGDPNGYIDAKTDVVPLGTLLGKQQPFERVMPSPPQSGQPYGAMKAGDRYVVAWGPDTQATSPPTPTPTMLRFTVTLDDMSNRTGNGQTFEYVVPLQP